MALVVKDRVQETTGVTGTGSITLAGAALGYQSFSVIGNGNSTYYAINDPITGDWEVGIGTYSTTGPTLTRTTVLSSSNAGALVSFSSGTKNVFCTYPSERAVYLDSPGSYPVQSTFNTLTAATATLTAGTITTAPTGGTDIVNKDYADSIASGLNYHQPVNYASTTALPAYTYNNGASGVGATITAVANGALSFGGGSPTVGQRLLVKDEAGANQPYNGIYTVTQTGSLLLPFILTRATDYDSSGTGTNEVDAGDYVLVISGTNASTAWVQQTPLPITIGTTALVFLQFNAPITYNAGTGLNLSPATTFNISNTGVTATTYGSASQVPVFAVNAQGQLTSVTNTSIAISAGAVSGLAPSATTDTTNATNITSGTLPSGRLSGSYTGVTGVGTLTAGTWNATAIDPVYGGTGFTSYAVGDLVYADTTTSLAKLADVAVGNALISGGVSAAPSWGKIGLATHVSGTLPIANGGTGTSSTQFVDLTTNVTGTLPVSNGGTGAATFTANNVLLGNGTSAFQVVAPGTNGNVLQSNGTTWVSAATPSTMVYPGAGIPNSTGTSWGTSYSTTGSGTVVALATSPSFTTPILGTPQSGDFSTGTFTWPTFNQNTTGSAATLTTPRAIYGNNFDGSAALTQIIASTYGGTGNGFTKFSGATTSEKTYTLPDATCSILTSNAAVTVAQGGTGQTSYTDGQLLIGNTTGNTLTKATLTAGTGISITNGAGSISIASTVTAGVTSVTGTSPVASSGGTTPAISLSAAYGDTLNPYASKTANFFLAAPNGAAGVPTFRAIVAADIPTLNQNTTGTATNATNVAITDDTTTAATYYPAFMTATSGNGGVRVSSTKLTYNPSTGALSSTSHVSSSDARLKTNWRDLPTYFIEQLAKVKAGIYDRTDFETLVTQVGVPAQDLQPVLPHAVLSDEKGMLSVAYGNAALVACIKLSQRVLELEAKLEQLTKDKL